MRGMGHSQARDRPTPSYAGSLLCRRRGGNSVSSVVAPVRLRQVVVISKDLDEAERRLETDVGLAPGFRDEGVGYFGLENRVLAAGESFVEVLTPLDEDSAGHRFLERRGSDSGYMAIFQFRDREQPRRRAVGLGMRIAWQADLDDISGTHLDPRDVTGAIVSLDWADPPESWHWAGPSWRGDEAIVNAASSRGYGITSLEVAVEDPPASAAIWASVLGPDADLKGSRVTLADAGQLITFVQRRPPEHDGIVSCGLALPPEEGRPPASSVEIAGVLFSVVRAPAATEEEL